VAINRGLTTRAITRGFTLLELLVVIAVIALGTAGVALAMRDSGQTLVEREATRLAALLDAARSQSRATGRMVTWSVAIDAKNQPVMRWRGLKNKEPLPTAWLDAQTRVIGNARLVLGPDPVIAPQSIQLTIGQDSRLIATDGVGLFTVQNVVQP
jgi:general secretion pathway protein H